MRAAHRELVAEATHEQHLPNIPDPGEVDPDANIDDLEDPHAGPSGTVTQAAGGTTAHNRTRRSLFNVSISKG